MKVAYEASSVRQGQSGVGYYAESLLESLLSEFPGTRFLLLSHCARNGTHDSRVTATQKLGFPIKEVWMQLWVPAILSRHAPDLCHFTNGIAPLYSRFPYVVTLHDLSLIRHPEWHPRSRRAWMRRILRPSITRASGVICDSEKTRSDLLEWIPLDPSRIAVVPLAARRRFFEIRADEEIRAVRRRFGLVRPYILYLGNIEPRKNLARVLEAFDKLDAPDLEFVIAGRRAWLCEDIVRLAGRSRGRVRILDYVREDDLSPLYQAAVAFVYPSLMEGFGLPVLEAMASGTAVVASDIEPLSSLLGGAGLLVHPEDVGGWRSAILEFLRDPGRRRSLATEGRMRAREFSWERTARETMNFYERIFRGLNDAGRTSATEGPALHAGKNRDCAG